MGSGDKSIRPKYFNDSDTRALIIKRHNRKANQDVDVDENLTQGPINKSI